MSLQRRLHSRGSLSGYSRAGSLCNIQIHLAISDQQQVSGPAGGSWQVLFFCVEGDAQAVEVFVPLLRGLGLQVQIISPESKAQYHLSCALASNFVCALVQRSADLLGGCGFSKTDALRALCADSCGDNTGACDRARCRRGADRTH